MNEIRINEKISYIAASDAPLSADIGIIREGGVTWLYDVGCGGNPIEEPAEGYNIVLSHFHQDHVGNVDSFPNSEFYVSKETYAHVHKGTIVRGSMRTGNIHVFPLPSSHAKGCLGLQIDDTYAFVGDALYCKTKDGCRTYNAQLLQDEIAVLKKLKASFLLISHREGMIRKKDDVIDELDMIYRMRTKNEAIITISN